MLTALPWSCGGEAPTPSASASAPPPSESIVEAAIAPPPAAPVLPPGPVIPASDPSWAQMEGFLDDPAAYGLDDWGQVRAEVAAHVAVIGRDLARERVAAGDWAGCAAAYARAASAVDRALTRGSRSLGPPTPAEVKGTTSGKAAAAAPGPGPSAVAPVRAALERDRRMCAAIAHHHAPDPPSAGIARLRALRMGAAAPEGSATPEQVAAEVRSGLAALGPGASVAELRAAYADAVDPFVASDPWGTFGAPEVERQLAGALLALRAPEPADPRSAAQLAAGALAAAPTPLTALEMTGVPAADALVEVAGFPGVLGRGRLAMLGPDDAAHRAWLERKASEFEAVVAEALPAAMAAVVADLETRPYGSRYYNIRKSQYAALRALASSGHVREALEILGSLRPLRAQDWASVDRAAVLTAIEGRLLLVAGDSLAASTLEGALAEVAEFLGHVADREAKADAAEAAREP